MRSQIRPHVVRVLSAAVLAAAPLAAHASGFALLEQSASRLGTAFAGTTAAAEDATTIFFNPAGMSRLKAPQVVAVASGIEITSEFNNQASIAAYGQPLGTEGGDAGDWNFVPSGYLAWPINESLAVGVGVGAPFGLKLEYPTDFMGRYMALLSEIKTYNFNPSLSWKINEQWSIGVGVNYQRIQAELTNAVNYSAVIAGGVQQLVAAGQLPASAAPAVLASTTNLSGGASVRGDDDAFGFNVGVLFTPSEATRIGLSWRQGPEYEVDGWIGFTAPQVANPIGAQIVAGAGAPGGPLESGPVSVDLQLPDNIIGSLRQELSDRFALLIDVAWVEWSTIEELRVVRDSGATATVTPELWEDAWRYALGGEFEWSDRLTLRAGVAYDEGTVPDFTRTPRLPDPDRTWVAIGASWRMNEAFQIDVGYAHLFSDDVPIQHTSGAVPGNRDPQNIATYGFLSGEQESDIDIISTQVVWRF